MSQLSIKVILVPSLLCFAAESSSVEVVNSGAIEIDSEHCVFTESGSTTRHAADQNHSMEVQNLIRPLFDAMPKDDSGKVSRSLVISLLQLFFAKHHIAEPTGRASSERQSWMTRCLHRFSDAESFSLAEIRAFASSVEDLITRSALNSDGGATLYDHAIMRRLKNKRVEKYREEFSETCQGEWKQWSSCTESCYRNRSWEFDQDKDKDCPNHAPAPSEEQWEVCQHDDCPLDSGTDGLIFGQTLNLIFKHGFNTGKVSDVGSILAEFQIFLQATILFVIVALALMQQLDIVWMSDIGVAIPMAAIFAFIIRASVGFVSFGPALNEVFGTVVSRLMNDVLIPISIFEGSYHCQQLNFYSQFFTGVFFAVVGTLVSAIIIAWLVHVTGDFGWHDIKTWREAFAYAAFIADVDPVATLSIFSNLRVDNLLSAVVAGEATLNDPIALVIFGICNAHDRNLSFSFRQEGLNTIILLGGSILIGCGLGLILVRMISFFRISGKGQLETFFVFQCAFISFVVGEFFSFSGIIVTLFCGLVMGIYTEQVVEDHESVKIFIYNAARMADICMFIIIGLTLMLIDDMEGIWLGLLTIICCFVARAIMIVMLVPFINLCKRLKGLPTIPLNTAFMMFHSGLRGGMTVMMALMLDPYWMGADNKNTCLIATIVTVIGMCYLCGCTGPFFLKLTGVPMLVEQVDGNLQHRRTFLSHTNRIVEMMVTPSSKSDKSPASRDSDDPMRIRSCPPSSGMQGLLGDNSGSNGSFTIEQSATEKPVKSAVF